MKNQRVWRWLVGALVAVSQGVGAQGNSRLELQNLQMQQQTWQMQQQQQWQQQQEFQQRLMQTQAEQHQRILELHEDQLALSRQNRRLLRDILCRMQGGERAEWC